MRISNTRMNHVEQTREAFRPLRIRILFVGESAPVSGKFFYFGNTSLARYTQRAFERAFDKRFESENQFLSFFRDSGCWLDDLCREPVNHLDDRERKQRLNGSVDGFAERLRGASPEGVVVVVKRISKYVNRALVSTDLNPVIHYLPFPSFRWQSRYVDELVDVLQDMNGTTPASPGMRVTKKEEREMPESTANRSITLHEEIQVILRERGSTMALGEIADEVNRRGNYRKKDGSIVEEPQIHGRTRQYRKLFARNKSIVGLVEWGDHDIAAVFDLMDKWRHLPNYQLERRSDIFFAHFLSEILRGVRNLRIHPVIVPEFPVHIGTIHPEIPINKSYKIDYVAFSEDLSEAYLIELKTDDMSRRVKQDKYLVATRKKGFEALLGGLLTIFDATTSKRKYYQLISMLADLGFYSVPDELHELIGSDNLHGISECIKRISVQNLPRIVDILYIQPNGADTNVINFASIASVLEESHSPAARRFAASLRSWSATEAGNPADL